MTQMMELTTQLMPRGRQTKFTPERVQQIKNLVERGRSLEEIAEFVGTTVGSLRVTCSRLGVSLRRPIFDTETGLLRRRGPWKRSSSRGSSVPLQPTKEQPKPTSQLGPVEQAPAKTPNQERARTNEAGSANFAIRIQYKGEDRTTELPFTQDMIRQLASEAVLRDMRIGELISELIIAIMKKDHFQRVLESDQTRKMLARTSGPAS
jgi:hypothetical protein